MVYSFKEVLKKYKDHDYYIFYADIIFDVKNVSIIKNLNRIFLQL